MGRRLGEILSSCCLTQGKHLIPPALGKVSEDRYAEGSFLKVSYSLPFSETERGESFHQHQCSKVAEKAVGAIVVKSLASELWAWVSILTLFPPSWSALSLLNRKLIKSL